MKYLIVSADDLGLSESINSGLIKSKAEGIVTALNILASGDAFYDAMSLVRQIKPGEISAHLALTETSPVSDAGLIPTLLAADGKFHKSYPGFMPGYVLKTISRQEIYIELKNQMERLKGQGISITSISSHQHIHMLPGVLEIFIRLAKEYNVPAIRYLHRDRLSYPYKIGKFFKKAALKIFDSKMKSALDKASICHADNLLGFFDSGNIYEDLLIGMLNHLPEGVTELVTHPGFISADVLDRCIFHRTCETDLAALTSRRVKKAVEDNGIKLITFSDLANLRNK